MSSLIMNSVAPCPGKGPFNWCATVESPTFSGTVYLANRNPIATPFGAPLHEFHFFIQDAESVDGERHSDEQDAVTWLGEIGDFELLGRIVMLDMTGQGAYFQSAELTLYLPIDLFPPFSLILSDDTKFLFRTRSLAVSI